MKKYLALALLLLAGSVAHAQTITMTGGTQTAQGTTTVNGTGTSSLSSPVTFTCTGNGATSITAYIGPIMGTTTPVAASASGTGSASVTTNQLMPGANGIQCSTSTTGGTLTLVGYFDTVSNNPNYSYVLATELEDASGNPMTSGTFCATPVDYTGRPTAFTAGGGGTIRPQPVCRSVANGKITSLLLLARSNLSIPLGVTYNLSLTDGTTGIVQNLGIASVVGDTFNVSTWAPSTVQTAPPAAWVPTIAIGNVTTVSTNSLASIYDSGTALGHVFNFNIPAGATGLTGPTGPAGPAGPATLAIGTVSTLPAGSNATATNVGTSNAAILNLGIPAGPTGTATSAGKASDLQLSGGTGVGTTGDDAVQVVDHGVIALGPRVNIRDLTFATGTGISAHPGVSCVGVDGNPTGRADNTGVYNSECAIRNAATFATYTSFGGMHPTLYIPNGQFLVSVPGTTGVVVFNGANVSVVGDDKTSSVILNNSPQASAFTWVSDYGVSVSNLQIAGAGAASTGNGLEVLDTQAMDIEHLYLDNFGGIGVNVQGSSERVRMLDINAQNLKQAVNSWGNTNEDYVHNFDFTFNGQSGSWNYGSNANPLTGVSTGVACSATPTTWSSSTAYTVGQTVTYNSITYNVASASTGSTPQLISTSWNECGQAPRPEERAVVFLDGDNWELQDGSIKGTTISGARLNLSDASIKHTYFESSDVAGGNDNYPTYSLSIGNGKEEISHLTSGFTATGTVVGVDDASFQHLYVTDPALDTHVSNTYAWAIFPSDYVYGSTAVSASNPNMLAGQYELVNPQSFSNDGLNNGFQGSLHIATRAVNGSVAPGVACGGSVTTACGPGPINAGVAWPAPSLVNGVLTFYGLVSSFPQAEYGSALVANNHLEMLHNGSVGTGQCSDTAILGLNTQWLGNPSSLCAEVLLGSVPDGLTLQQPQISRNGSASGSATFIGNTIFSNSYGETAGFGQIKIANSGTAIIDQGNAFKTSLYNPSTYFTQYDNANTHVATVNYGNNVTALSYVNDLTGGFQSNNQGYATSQFNEGSATVFNAAATTGIATQTVGASACNYPSSYGDTATPTTRTCLGTTGYYTQTYNGSSWTTLSTAATTPASVTVASSSTIPTTSTSVFLSATSGSITPVLPTCATGSNIGLALNLARSDVNSGNTVTLSDQGGGQILIDGTTTGSGGIDSVGMPIGASWIATCDSSVNSYAQWRIYTRRSGITGVTFALGSGAAGSLTPASTTNTMNGSTSLSLTTAAVAGSPLINVTFPNTHIPDQSCSAATTGSTGVPLPTGTVTNTGFAIYTPAAGLAVATYNITYNCGR